MSSIVWISNCGKQVPEPIRLRASVSQGEPQMPTSSMESKAAQALVRAEICGPVQTVEPVGA